jgi:hypothetical protein
MIEILESRQLMTATGIAEPSSLDTPSAPPPVVVSEETQPSAKLLAELMSNIMKTRSEISMTFARNARA